MKAYDRLHLFLLPRRSNFALQAQSYENKWQFSIFILKKIENSLHAYIESATNPVFKGVSPNFEPT